MCSAESPHDLSTTLDSLESLVKGLNVHKSIEGFRDDPAFANADGLVPLYYHAAKVPRQTLLACRVETTVSPSYHLPYSVPFPRLKPN